MLRKEKKREEGRLYYSTRASFGEKAWLHYTLSQGKRGGGKVPVSIRRRKKEDGAKPKYLFP